MDLITLFDSFRGISFDEKEHKYVYNGKPATSVIRIINELIPDFLYEQMADSFAKKNNMNTDTVKYIWLLDNVYSTAKEKIIHKYIAEYFKKIKYPILSDEVRERVTTYVTEELNKKIIANKINVENIDPVQITYDINLFITNILNNAYLLCKNQVFKFLQDIELVLVPIASEFIMGHEPALVCGTADQIFYNKKHNCLQIWGWKTNKQIDKETYGNFKLIGYDIPATNFHEYSLQQSFYKTFLNKQKIYTESSYIVHFNEASPRYTYLKCIDYTDIVEHILLGREKDKSGC